MEFLGSNFFQLSCWTILILLFVQWQQRRKEPKATRLGIAPGIFNHGIFAARKEFTDSGDRMVAEAYQKCPDSNFLVQTQDMERLIVSPKFLPELRMLPESKLSHSVALVEKHLGTYSGVDTILESHQHSDVCRLQLTQNLHLLVPKMAEELEFAMSRHLDSSSTNGSARYITYQYVFAMVLSVSSRVFVGEALCRDPRWLQTVSAYLSGVVTTANALRPYPRLLRPLLQPFLAPSHRMKRVLADAQSILGSAIEERKTNPAQSLDLLRFLVDTSKDGKHMPIILKLLVLTSAALHTSTAAAVNCIFDLCARPDSIDLLRQEAEVALRTNNNLWRLSSINQLRHLDSFMKESLRFTQPDILGFNRVVRSPIKLSDSITTIPPGTFICMPAGPMSRDPRFYTDPNNFNPNRFYGIENDRTDASQSPKYDFSGIEKGNVAWGNGRLTCPGRWYTSAMNKLIIGVLLADYDISLPQGQQRPASNCANGTIMPSFTQEIEIRKRL